MEVEWKFIGGRELKAALAELPKNIERRVTRRALLAGSRLFAKRIRVVLPRGGQTSPSSKAYGPLHKNVIVRRPRLNGREMTVRVGYHSDGFYGVWLEYGNSRQPPNPIWRRNAPIIWPDVQQVIKDKLAKDIPIEAAKVFRRTI